MNHESEKYRMASHWAAYYLQTLKKDLDTALRDHLDKDNADQGTGALSEKNPHLHK